MVNMILSIILYISLFVTVFLGVYALLYCESKIIASYIALLTTVFLYTLGYLLEITAHTEEGGFIGSKVTYMGSAFTAPVLLMFVIDYCKVKINRKWLLSLLIVPLAVLVLVWTTDKHHLIYRSFQYDSVSQVHHLSKTSGPLYFVVHAYGMACVFITIAILINRLKIWEAKYRPNLMLLILGTVVPTLGNILYLLKLNMFGVNYTPVLLTVLNIMFCVNIIRHDLFDVMPIASEKALQSMSESFVLLDANYGFLKANASAVKLFPGLQTLNKSEPVTQVQNWPAELLPAKNKELVTPVKFEMPDENYFTANISEITAKKGTVSGHIILIQDNTDSTLFTKKLELTVAKRTRQLEKRTRQLRASHEAIIMGMSLMSELHDEITGEHIKRIKLFTRLLAEKVAEKHPELISKEFADKITLYAPLHDVGKNAISDIILKKPGTLTQEEFDIMKSHTTSGTELLKKTKSFLGYDDEGLSVAIDIAGCHHERYDGTGYPCCLSGDDIPIAARIVMLTDIYDALRSPRTYKRPYTHDETLDILYKGDGRVMPSHFDPRVLEAFYSIHHLFNEYQW